MLLSRIILICALCAPVGACKQNPEQNPSGSCGKSGKILKKHDHIQNDRKIHYFFLLQTKCEGVKDIEVYKFQYEHNEVGDEF
jgi:hypothetical protein